jgi:hypothetical protein
MQIYYGRSVTKKKNKFEEAGSFNVENSRCDNNDLRTFNYLMRHALHKISLHQLIDLIFNRNELNLHKMMLQFLGDTLG